MEVEITIPGVVVERELVRDASIIRVLGKQQNWSARFIAAVQKSAADRAVVETFKATERAVFVKFRAFEGDEDVSSEVVSAF